MNMHASWAAEWALVARECSREGVALLRGRVQCVGEGRESSPFEGIALLTDWKIRSLVKWGGVAATRVAGLAVEAARNPIFAS